MKYKNIHEEILELTQELIRFPSTHSRPDEIQGCAYFIEKWLSKYGISYERYNSARTPSIVVLPGKNKPKVLLATHFDVVETEDNTLFNPRIENGNLFGRGAIDDKYGVALSLIIFREHFIALQKQGKEQNDMAFGLLLTGDEEVGGANGAAKAVENIDTEFFIVLDGGNPKHIVTKEKGIILLQMESQGKSAHAARPWLGQNSFDLLIDDYLKIKQMFCETSPDHWHKTMVLSQCVAGNGSYNMVPQNCFATLDIRYTEEDDPDDIIAAITRTVQSKISVKAKEPLFSSGPSNYLNQLRDCSKDSSLSFEHGASDARYFSKKGIPGVIWGADGEMSQHTEDEHVVIDSIFWLYDRLNLFLADLKRPVSEIQQDSAFLNYKN